MNFAQVPLAKAPASIIKILMSKEGKKERDQERVVSTPKFVATLRRAADALEAGKAFVIQVKGERIRVPREAELSVEHEREGKEEELEMQLRWKNE